MIYMVDHVFTNPATEPEWHAWYSGYLQKLLSVPGIHSAQRFKAVNETPSRFLAMYSLDSADVYTSQGYKNIGGGGSQSARFHPDYQSWTRNLFEGATAAPPVGQGQHVIAFDRPAPDPSLAPGFNVLWLRSVGLHMTTPYRGIIVLNQGDVAPTIAQCHIYEPFTPPLGK